MSSAFFTIALLTGIVVLIVGVVGSIAQGFRRKCVPEMTPEEHLKMALKLNEEAKKRYEEWKSICEQIDADIAAKKEKEKQSGG